MGGDAPSVNQRDQHIVPYQHVVQGLGDSRPSAHVAGAHQFPQQPVIGRIAIARNVLSLPTACPAGVRCNTATCQDRLRGRRFRIRKHTSARRRRSSGRCRDCQGRRRRTSNHRPGGVSSRCRSPTTIARSAPGTAFGRRWPKSGTGSSAACHPCGVCRPARGGSPTRKPAWRERDNADWLRARSCRSRGTARYPPERTRPDQSRRREPRSLAETGPPERPPHRCFDVPTAPPVRLCGTPTDQSHPAPSVPIPTAAPPVPDNGIRFPEFCCAEAASMSSVSANRTNPTINATIRKIARGTFRSFHKTHSPAACRRWSQLLTVIE